MRAFQHQKRDAVIELYRLILDRDPESEQVINEKRKCRSLKDVARDMLMSDEFVKRNEAAIREALY